MLTRHETSARPYLKILGIVLDLVVSPIKVLKRLEVGFSTIEIKKPEFDNEKFGLPSLSYIPKGFMLGLRLDLLNQIQNSMDIIGQGPTRGRFSAQPKPFCLSRIWDFCHWNSTRIIPPKGVHVELNTGVCQ